MQRRGMNRSSGSTGSQNGGVRPTARVVRHVSSTVVSDTSIAPPRPALTAPDSLASRRDGTRLADRAVDGRELAHALRRLVRGELPGMVDGPSTTVLDPAAAMVVLDLSGLGSNDDALACAMTCASAWLEAALGHGISATSGQRRIVYDEAWRLMRSLPLVRRTQARWKLPMT
jgi:hypothetical protein